MPDAPLRIGVIGLGFTGSTHARCYQSAARAGLPCALAAIADHDPRRHTGEMSTAGNIATGNSERLFDPTLVRAYTHGQDLLADPDIDAVSICTPTRTHADLALAALRAGKHVLVEKPIALDLQPAQLLLDEAAKHPALVCMPAMVMRFWPGWSAIRDAIRSSSPHGPLRSLTLLRRGSTPTWSRFYADPAQTGGALFDLHVHDADFILWTLGTPASIATTGDINHLSTLYRYNSGPIHVLAEAGLDHDPAFGFHIHLTAVFQNATLDFNLSRSPNLRLFQKTTATDLPAPPEGPFDLEIRAFVAAAHAARHAAIAPQPVPLADAVAALRLLHAEQQSMTTRRDVSLH